MLAPLGGLHGWFASNGPMASCVSLPEDILWPQGVARLLYGQTRNAREFTAQKWPSTITGWDLGVNILVSSPFSGLILSPRGSWLQLSPVVLVVMSPTGVSWDHLPNNILAPKSVFLTLMGTQTKWSPKHQSYLQIESRRSVHSYLLQKTYPLP